MYASVLEFIMALAALTVVFYDEVQNKTEMKSKQLKHVLMAAAAPGRVGWYFNNQRIRHAMRAEYRTLLPSGTSSNESLHAEINRWFRNQPEVYISTLILQLRINWIAKLMVHNAALYTPLLRNHDQGTLLIAIAAKWSFGANAWADWVGSPLALELADARRSTECALRARKVPRRIIRKKPAYSVSVKKLKKQVIKRTPLNRTRVKL